MGVRLTFVSSLVLVASLQTPLFRGRSLLCLHSVVFGGDGASQMRAPTPSFAGQRCDDREAREGPTKHLRGRTARSVEDYRLVPVLQHAVFQMQADGTGQYDLLQIASLAN